MAEAGNHVTRVTAGPNTLIKQRVEPVAIWDNICQVLPADIRLALTPPEHPASWEVATASLFGSPNLAPDEQRIFAVPRADELTTSMR